MDFNVMRYWDDAQVVNPIHDRRFRHNTAAGAALNDALERGQNANMTVMVPPGNYDIEVPVGYFDRTQLIAADPANTVLNFTGTGSMFFNAQGSRVFSSRFAGFECQNSGPATNVGFDWDSVSNSEMDRLVFKDFGTGVQMNGATSEGNGGTDSASLYNSFNWLRVDDCTTGVLIDDSANSNWFHSFKSSRCGTGVDMIDANQITFHGGSVESSVSHGMDLRADVGKLVRFVSCFGVRFERNDIAWEADATTANCSFFGNMYDGNTTGVIDNGSETIRMEANVAFWGGAGFNNVPVVSGSRAGNAALQSLLNRLTSYGLVDDQTTA